MKRPSLWMILIGWFVVIASGCSGPQKGITVSNPGDSESIVSPSTQYIHRDTGVVFDVEMGWQPVETTETMVRIEKVNDPQQEIVLTFVSGAAIGEQSTEVSGTYTQIKRYILAHGQGADNRTILVQVQATLVVPATGEAALPVRVSTVLISLLDLLNFPGGDPLIAGPYTQPATPSADELAGSQLTQHAMDAMTTFWMNQQQVQGGEAPPPAPTKFMYEGAAFLVEPVGHQSAQNDGTYEAKLLSCVDAGHPVGAVIGFQPLIETEPLALPHYAGMKLWCADISSGKVEGTAWVTATCGKETLPTSTKAFASQRVAVGMTSKGHNNQALTYFGLMGKDLTDEGLVGGIVQTIESPADIVGDVFGGCPLNHILTGVTLNCTASGMAIQFVKGLVNYECHKLKVNP